MNTTKNIPACAKWERRPGENGPALVRVFGPQDVIDHDMTGERAKVPGGVVTLARRIGAGTVKPGYPTYMIYEATDVDYDPTAEAEARYAAELRRVSRESENPR